MRTWTLIGLMLPMWLGCTKEEEEPPCEDTFLVHPFPHPWYASLVPDQWLTSPLFIGDQGAEVVFDNGYAFPDRDCPGSQSQMIDCGPQGFYYRHECQEQRMSVLQDLGFDVRFLLSVHAVDGVRICMDVPPESATMEYCLQFDPLSPPAILASVVINGSTFYDVFAEENNRFYYNKAQGIVGFNFGGHTYALQE